MSRSNPDGTVSSTTSAARIWAVSIVRPATGTGPTGRTNRGSTAGAWRQRAQHAAVGRDHIAGLAVADERRGALLDDGHRDGVRERAVDARQAHIGQPLQARGQRRCAHLQQAVTGDVPGDRRTHERVDPRGRAGDRHLRCREHRRMFERPVARGKEHDREHRPRAPPAGACPRCGEARAGAAREQGRHGPLTCPSSSPEAGPILPGQPGGSRPIAPSISTSCSSSTPKRSRARRRASRDQRDRRPPTGAARRSR